VVVTSAQQMLPGLPLPTRAEPPRSQASIAMMWSRESGRLLACARVADVVWTAFDVLNLLI
jgi:hypothetical protein